jgi:CHAT domain-containing protein
VSENNAIAAIERAEFYKNRCLNWILDGCEETYSPRYFEIQSLCKRDTAILYWHLSIDNLTTFIVTANSDIPFVLESDRRQQAQELEKWTKSWDVYYRDYAEKKIPATIDRLNHPWRKELNSKLAGLYHILQVDNICKQLEQSPSKIKKLILIPHRDLHRFPIHTCFTEFSCAYLPSAQIGLNLQNRSQKGSAYSPLLSVEDPKTDQPKMPFAQLESAIVRCLVDSTTIPIKSEVATIEIVSNALEKSHTTFHFTGHGAYNSFRPETSALALSDGLLTVRDVSKLNLSSYRLVCLAACETALTGKDSVTQNEYIGLASAFLQAGVSNVLSTLWPVDEIASCWFTIYFYQKLTSSKLPEIALLEAQKWLQTVTLTELSDWINQLSKLPGLEPGIVDRLEARAKNIADEGSIIGSANVTPYSHPYYWGAFTLTGQG